MQKKSISLTIKSEFNELEKIDGFIEEASQMFKLSDETVGKLHLILSELATNAIKHGNKFEPEKQAFISLGFNNGSLVLTVKDEGDGFNPEEVPDPMKEENMLKTSGRGIHICKEFAKNISYNEKGNIVTVTVD